MTKLLFCSLLFILIVFLFTVTLDIAFLLSLKLIVAMKYVLLEYLRSNAIKV